MKLRISTLLYQQKTLLSPFPFRTSSAAEQFVFVIDADTLQPRKPRERGKRGRCRRCTRERDGDLAMNRSHVRLTAREQAR